VARLCDRLAAHGSRPVSVLDLLSGGRTDEELLAVAGDGDPAAASAWRDFLATAAEQRSVDRAPSGFAPFDLALLVIGDEVGHFAASQPPGIDLVGMLAAVIPPFRHTFVDFRGVPNPMGLPEWGVLFTAVDLDEEVRGVPWRTHVTSGPAATFGGPAPGEARWTVWGSVYGSRDGRTQLGPFGSCQLHLDEHGEILRNSDGEQGVDWLVGGDPRFDEVAGILLTDDPRYLLTSMLFPALLTLSFMHAKNIDVVERRADPRQSRAFRRRHGRELKDRYVLEISPLRRVLEDDGGIGANGLARALHLCRGHLRTYTSERPLFGRHVGTFWVKAHPRGNRSAGVLDKDYRVATDAPAAPGRGWRDDDPEVAPAAHAGGSNPDLSGRGWRAHARTLNALAAHLSGTGAVPLRPTPDGPQFDCAWEGGGHWWVAEVKSVTDDNEAEQIRRGIGQVVDYRHALADATGSEVRAALVLEREPASRYVEVCAGAGVVVAWPGAFDRLGR